MSQNLPSLDDTYVHGRQSEQTIAALLFECVNTYELRADVTYDIGADVINRRELRAICHNLSEPHRKEVQLQADDDGSRHTTMQVQSRRPQTDV